MDHFDEATKARIKADEAAALQDAVNWLKAGAPLPKEPFAVRLKRWMFPLLGSLLVLLRLAKVQEDHPENWSAYFRGKFVCAFMDSRRSALAWVGLHSWHSRFGTKKTY